MKINDYGFYIRIEHGWKDKTKQIPGERASFVVDLNSLISSIYDDKSISLHSLHVMHQDQDLFTMMIYRDLIGGYNNSPNITITDTLTFADVLIKCHERAIIAAEKHKRLSETYLLLANKTT